MRASTWDRRLESLWLARKRRSSNDILRNKIPYRFQPVSEFVFGTHNAAFVQAMYEDYLRDPASVDPEWREIFYKRKMAALPRIPPGPPGNGNVERGTQPPPPPTPPLFPVPAP